MQVYCNLVAPGRDREAATVILNRSLDRWIELIRGVARCGPGQPVLFPEFTLQGYPITESADEWIEKACIEIPGPETGRLQRLVPARKLTVGVRTRISF